MRPRLAAATGAPLPPTSAHAASAATAVTVRWPSKNAKPRAVKAIQGVSSPRLGGSCLTDGGALAAGLAIRTAAGRFAGSQRHG